MFRLPSFLALSVSLHLLAGSLLLHTDRGVADALRAKTPTSSPAVVQLQLEPLPAPPSPKPAAQRASAAPVKPGVAQVVAKPLAEPQRSASIAKSPRQPAAKPLPQAAAAARPMAAASASTVAAATVPPVATLPPVSTPVEVFSRQPAFRLPPQQPRYPAQARRRNQQGVVLLEVRLDEHGKQREISLLRSSGFPSLDQAALEAVAQWRFHPETLNGQGVPSRVHIPIEFALLASR